MSKDNEHCEGNEDSEFARLIELATEMLHGEILRVESDFEKHPIDENEARAWLILGRTSNFAVDCLDAINGLVHADLALQASILTRSFYEASVRLLWSARIPDGWRRIHAEGLTSARTWADEAKEFPEYREIALGILEVTRAALSEWWEKHKENIPKSERPIPKMKSMHRQIHAVDVEDGLQVEDSDAWRRYYTNYYRSMSMHSH